MVLLTLMVTGLFVVSAVLLSPAAIAGGVAKEGAAPQRVEERAGSISPADAAARIAKERMNAEAQRPEALDADGQRKAKQAEDAAAEAARTEARKREQAEDLARRKAESDKIIAEQLENLRKAREEADRAKAIKRAADTPSIKLERSALSGERSGRRKAGTHAAENRRCASGHVVYRKGRRWYVTGADDTLWQIAKKFYGSGSAYPRIYRANRNRLASPHVVRPCLALRLPGRR